MVGVAIAFKSVDPASGDATRAREQFFTEFADRFVEGRIANRTLFTKALAEHDRTTELLQTGQVAQLLCE